MIEFFSGCNSEDLMEFSNDLAVNPFGSELVRISSDIYDDIDEAIEQLAIGLNQRGFDVDEDTIYGFMSGELLPTEDVLEAFADLCVDEDGVLDEGEFSRLVSSAQSAHDLAADFYEASMEEEYEDEDDDEEYYEEDEEYEEEEYEDEDYTDPQVQALQSQLDALTTREVETAELDSLVQYGRDLQEDGILPPIAFSLLFGDPSEGISSKYAEFSTQCEEKEIPNALQLDRINYTLSVFEQIGPIMNFSSMAPEQYEEADRYADADVDATVAAYLDN